MDNIEKSMCSEEVEYLKKMRKYLETLEKMPKKESRITLIRTGVINENGNPIDHYKDYDPYLASKPNKIK